MVMEVMEMLQVSAIQDAGHQPRAAVEGLSCGKCSQGMKFSILLNFN